MLVDYTLVPLGSGTHLSSHISKIVDIIDASGLPYRLTPSGTCIEGEWDDIMNVLRDCQDEARKRSSHIMSFIQIEDEVGEHSKLTRNIASIEESLGRAVKHDLIEA
ncbi:MAG: MTH1187 family thiamine-binding protein [Bacteroidota bacterium]|nr:MTH1187 family thiamine-binding protein [Bacteroidota bacterium]MDP4234146.1 MTH1187 family thiamine-binding protein [Bacteroidota bacterium]MDP4244083.1 MTH1187 family thiamine-binding protein [Bacteroidota bacterium]MDP4289237.1 MTH1187 family thiamine-binding protein [Bacteroidota bacterium]